MTAEGLPLADLDLKRLALLLKKHNQAVPFDEPTVSINVIGVTLFFDFVGGRHLI